MLRRKLLIPTTALLLSAALFVGSVPASALYSSSVNASTKLVYASGRNFTVNVVTIDLTDPTLELAPALADGGIGHDESMQAIVEREDAVAAINGTFFNAYESDPYIRYPNGTLLAAGEPMHSGENQTLFLNKDKVPDIQFVDLDLSVKTSEGGGTYTISPWGINKYYGDSSTDQVVWYTPDFGRWIGFPGTKVVINDGLVTRITTDSVPVPDGGYVLFVGNSANNRQYVLPKLDVGDRITKNIVAKGEGGTALDAKSWLAAIGVGPKLVTNGASDIDVKRDGFSDPKVTQSSAARSFVGYDSANRLVMGTVPSATLSELAAISIALGLKEAMNMDGGSSSGLYANGTMMTYPGRKLSNALVVRKLDNPKVQIEINGQYVSDFSGFIVNETTIVPIRPFITAMNADFSWDSATRTATITDAGVTLKLRDGSSTATVNGVSVSVPVPLRIMADSRMYVPLRFVSESLKSNVQWNSKLYRASVQLP
ncbi:stalk domain-containing protein [Paenibacillus roseipurpureus]|uniref:Phosphodiester glycosidase family protein n=1 Tax=Paenibacillus roseopurpureus TaxID=2918901 RepID=A0AA96LS43_9BACL|nr:stalk domain-containing protein [Paenibacillus sp. MBLB1832]WNR46244.1 phosphodiester glycosidase family protein [Paenibacillus sp. MBLB1832]